MKIRKGLITAAARTQRQLPLQTLIDREGEPKAALRILLEEAVAAGIEEFCVVVCPGATEAYAGAAGDLAGRIRFVEQAEPRGYGHAILQGREFVGNEAFLHLVGDHLQVAQAERSCAAQLLEVAMAEETAVSAVQATRESLLSNYGAVGGKLVPGRDRIYQIDTVLEKPTPTEAEVRLLVPGLRAGFYLCFFGLHVLLPDLFELLEEADRESAGGLVQLSPALHRLAGRRRYLACELLGHRYDIGEAYGVFFAQLALGLEGKDRDALLARLVQMLAERPGVR
ncbi:MAG: UTP--glucose-1-phosphate uridylyltransferase [Puniceicoccaceae bacterium]|nr:MAG: UTP--glucose-1-phosphate uridylyltransferase [Puniceicoccaceae bacterium]